MLAFIAAMSGEKRPKARDWSHDENIKLIGEWSSEEFLNKVNCHQAGIYDKLSLKLKSLGVDRTGEQVRRRIGSLLDQYKDVSLVFQLGF